MALKYRVHVARSQKQEYQWLHKNEIKKRKTIFLKNTFCPNLQNGKIHLSETLQKKGKSNMYK